MSISNNFRFIIMASLSLSLCACITLPGHRQIIDEDGFYLKISAPNKMIRRDIRFNEEKTDVAHLPENARIELKVSDPRGQRQLVITSSGNSIVYNYKLNGRKAEFGDAEREWFASQVPKILRKTDMQNGPG